MSHGFRVHRAVPPHGRRFRKRRGSRVPRNVTQSCWKHSSVKRMSTRQPKLLPVIGVAGSISSFLTLGRVIRSMGLSPTTTLSTASGVLWGARRWPWHCRTSVPSGWEMRPIRSRSFPVLTPFVIGSPRPSRLQPISQIEKHVYHSCRNFIVASRSTGSASFLLPRGRRVGTRW